MKVSVRCTNCLSTPIAIGILRKYVVLPKRLYSDKELHYMLLHEYIHFQHQDLLLKFCIQIMFCICWWMPFHKFIQNSIEQTMELHCDQSVVQYLDKKVR